MNEISELSKELPIITAEINAYKRVAGEAIFEIGRRLKHVKENDLAHGKWERWCREEIDVVPSQARMFIKVADEFGSNRCTFNDLGLRALYEIATLPLEERTQAHTIPSTGATKTVDEMTVRELREVKAALKAEREAREKAEARAQKAEDDYDIIRDTLDAVSTTYVDDGLYRIDNQTEVNGAALAFSDRVRDFLKEYSYLASYCTELATASDLARSEYTSAIEALEDFVTKFRRNLNVMMADTAVVIDITN